MRNLFILCASLLAISTPISAQNSDSAEIYFQKGIEQKSAKRFLQSSLLFDKAIQFNPKFKEAYLENGFVNLEMRRTDQAMSHFNKVLELEPSNLAASKELIDLYYSYRQYAKARELANKCNKCSNAEKVKGMSLYNEEDYLGAVKSLTAYLAKNPEDAEATYTMARSYLDMEAYNQALPWYNKAVLLNSEKNAWAYELGLLYYNQQDFKNAVVYFNQAAEKGYPQRSDFKENLGYAYMYSGQFEQGEKLLLGLLEKKPSKDIMRDIAEAYYKGKAYDKSLTYCQKLMELDMKDGKALFQAGLCFQKMGQKDKGQAMCDKAIEYDPSLAGLRQKQQMPGF